MDYGNGRKLKNRVSQSKKYVMKKNGVLIVGRYLVSVNIELKIDNKPIGRREFIIYYA